MSIYDQQPGKTNWGPGWLPAPLSALGGRVIEPALGRIVGPPLDRAAIAERSQWRHLHAANVGAEAVKRATERGDPALRNYGEAMMLTALVKSAEDDAVPAAVTAEVADKISDTSVNLLDNPLLPPETVDQAAQIIIETREGTDG